MATLMGLPGRIAGIFAGAGSWLFSAGRDIVMGLVNGIGAAIGQAAAAAARLAASVVSAAKGALGIHSPSKVFEEQVGRMIPAGVSVGVTKGIPALGRTIDGMVSAPGIARGNTAPAMASVQPIYVQNPWTGEYMEARLAGTALRVVDGYDSRNTRESQRGSSGY